MSKPFAIGFGIAVVIIGLAVAYLFYAQRGQHLVPTGRILQVRTAALDSNSSALVLDFEVTNPSDRDMVVRTISVTVHNADGSAPDNSMIAATDLPAMFRYHTELGSIDHTPMRERDRIPPHQTVAGSTAVRFDEPEDTLKSRKSVQLAIEDVTGPILELTAK
jgi:hypothetical protein